MEPDGVSDDPRRVKHAFEVLDDHENQCHVNGMAPVAPLKCGDHHGWNPANDDADVRDHRQNHNHHANQWREVKPKQCERASDQTTVHETDEELAAEIGDDVVINFRENFRDFVFERRVAQGQVIFPAAFDARPLLEQEKQIDRHEHETEKKPGKSEETADALF